jgi:hypothetical protein
MVGSEPSTSASVVFNPRANKTIPATIGRCR